MRVRGPRGASRAPGLLSLSGGVLGGPVRTHAKARVPLLPSLSVPAGSALAPQAFAQTHSHLR